MSTTRYIIALCCGMTLVAAAQTHARTPALSLATTASAAHASVHDDVFTQARDVIAKMQAAIAAGDSKAYLATIDRAEHEWWHEQQAWANDIASKPPSRSTIVPGQDWTLTSFDDCPAVEVSLTWRWTPQADDRVKPDAPTNLATASPLPASQERDVTFRARFVQRDGGLFYAGEAWQTVQGEHVIVACDPGLESAARAAADAFARIRGDVLAELDVQHADIASRTQRIKLYGSMRHLQHSIYPSYVFPLSGWNEPDESIKVVARPDATQQSFIALLAHEYGHVASFALGPRANAMPWWTLEGIAEVMVDQHDASLAERSRKQVTAWAREQSLAAFADLADFERVPLAQHGRVYRQGHDMLRYITTRFGVAARNRWLRAMAQGDSIDAASTRELTQDWPAIEAAWRDTCR
jgi:hypothetical protein